MTQDEVRLFGFRVLRHMAHVSRFGCWGLELGVSRRSLPLSSFNLNSESRRPRALRRSAPVCPSPLFYACIDLPVDGGSNLPVVIDILPPARPRCVTEKSVRDRGVRVCEKERENAPP